jgi:copper chaperone NosL
MTGRFLRVLILLMFVVFTGCQDNGSEKLNLQQAVAIESGDECHLCGMIITHFPGPKGQLYERGDMSVRKFCSTRDMFAYLLDPEHSHHVENIFVHNMAVTPWDHPQAEAYIDARKAWYVVNSRRKGAMGPTLASFADQKTAQEFIKEYGGSLYRFDQIDLALLSEIGFSKPGEHHQPDG